MPLYYLLEGRRMESVLGVLEHRRGFDRSISGCVCLCVTTLCYTPPSTIRIHLLFSVFLQLLCLGVFLYVALVDMMPELTSGHTHPLSKETQQESMIANIFCQVNCQGCLKFNITWFSSPPCFLNLDFFQSSSSSPLDILPNSLNITGR